MRVFVWHNGPVPKNLEVKQVYAFTRDGRLLLRIEDGHYSLAGGKPEKFDKDNVATLRREFLEEVNTELEDEVYAIGYQAVREPSGMPPYAQMRLTAFIKKIGPKRPDPDGGKTYDRILTSPKRAVKLLNWGREGKKMIKQAAKVAKKKLKLKKFSTVEEFV